MSALSARSKLALAVSAAAGALALAAPAAFADNLYVCQSCNSGPPSPTEITDPSQFTIGISGSATLQDPLLVIVGVYDGNASTTAPTLTFDGSAVSLAKIGTYGLQVDQSLFTSTSVSLVLDKHGKPENPTTAYNLLGLADQGASEQFGNWAGADSTGGVGSAGIEKTGMGLPAPGSFEVFAFEVDTSLSGAEDLFGISGAANGSFIIGYSCDSSKAASGNPPGPCGKGGIGNTPFTTSGVLDVPQPPPPVPEPGTLALFGTALAGLGFALRRRAKSL